MFLQVYCDQHDSILDFHCLGGHLLSAHIHVGSDAWETYLLADNMDNYTDQSFRMILYDAD